MIETAKIQKLKWDIFDDFNHCVRPQSRIARVRFVVNCVSSSKVEMRKLSCVIAANVAVKAADNKNWKVTIFDKKVSYLSQKCDR